MNIKVTSSNTDNTINIEIEGLDQRQARNLLKLLRASPKLLKSCENSLIALAPHVHNADMDEPNFELEVYNELWELIALFRAPKKLFEIPPPQDLFR